MIGLGLCALTAKGPGSIPGQKTKIPQAEQHNLKNNTHESVTRDQQFGKTVHDGRWTGEEGTPVRRL